MLKKDTTKLLAEKTKEGQRGQTVVLIVMVMMVALVMGVTLSSRFIKSLHSLSRMDDASRALTVAEAAVERFLMLDRATIDDYVQNGTCGADCLLDITDSQGRSQVASIELSYMGDSTDTYSIQIPEGAVEEVFLDGYLSGSYLDVCWFSDASVYASYVYESSGEIGSTAYAYSPADTPYPDDSFDAASSLHGIDNCFTVATAETPQLLRLKSYRGIADIQVIPAPAISLPVQGILITSRGVVGTAQEEVRVVLTNSSIPPLFDYAIMQFSPTDPLSNQTN
jgi:hypothetical protein